MGEGLTNLDKMRVFYKKMGEEVKKAPVLKSKEEMEKAISLITPGTCSANHTDFIQGVMPYYTMGDHLEEFGLTEKEYEGIMTTVNHYLVEFGKLCPADRTGSKIGDILATFNNDPVVAYNLYNERGFSTSAIETGKIDDAIACVSGNETVEGTPEAFEEAGITLDDLKALATLDIAQTPEG